MTVRGLQAIAQLRRVQERKARLMGLDAPTQRAVDVITHDAFMEVIENLEREVAGRSSRALRVNASESELAHARQQEGPAAEICREGTPRGEGGRS